MSDTSSARRAGTVALAGLLAAALGGTGGYLVARDARKSGDRADCSAVKCIPALKPETVATALAQRGFQCASGGISDIECKLKVGDTEFRAIIHATGGLISEVTGTERSDTARPPSAGKKAFLEWIGALPFGPDQRLDADIKSWLEPKLGAGQNAKAAIGGYTYELTAERTDNLSLRVVTEYE